MRTASLWILPFLGLLASCGGRHRGLVITVTQPAADTVATPGTTVQLAAVVANFPSGMALDFLADVDGDLSTSADQVVVVTGEGIAADGTASVPWNTTGVASASYAILARRTAADEPPARASGKVIVNVPPRLSILRPATDITVSRGGFAAVGYSDDDPDNDAETQFFADVDGDLATSGDQYTMSDVRLEQNGAPQEFPGDSPARPRRTSTSWA